MINLFDDSRAEVRDKQLECQKFESEPNCARGTRCQSERISVVGVLDHGLSIRVIAQGLLTERNNGKGIVAASGLALGGSEQINSTWPGLFLMTWLS